MQDKLVVIEIDEMGNSTIDLAGFQGQGCGDVAKDFRGDDGVAQSSKKREFYAQAVATRQTQRKA
jgi:hypothetical protein